MRGVLTILCLLGLLFWSSAICIAGVSSYAVRETAEFVCKKFGREALEEGADVLTRKIGVLASRYGDNALSAFRKVGPRVAGLADDAGEHAPLALRLLASHGDDAVRLVMRPKQLGLIARLGDDAAECLLKHGEAVEPLLHSLGTPAAQALRGVSSQNSRRLSMMLADGELAKLGHSHELLAVISKYGNSAAEFVWKNKGALAVGAGLTAFLTTPETFIHGGTELTSIVADAAVKPVVTAAAESMPWTGIGSIFGVVGGMALAIWALPRLLVRHRVDAFKSRKVEGQTAQEIKE